MRQIIIAMMLILALSACSLGNPEPTPTSTPTVTPLPSATATLTSTPTLIPTNTPVPTATATLRPTVGLPPACTKDLTFIADMSIPDGTAVTAGATITKTWRVRNDGTCTWNGNYTFRQVGGDALTAPTIASPVVGRGQIIDISVTLTVGTNVASYDDLERATFRMFDANGVPFGDFPYVEVAIEPQNTGGCTNQAILVNDPNLIGVLTVGEVDTVNWTIKNVGTCTWEGYQIQRLGSDSPLFGNNLPLTLPTIAPNQEHTFAVNISMLEGTAPSGVYSMSMNLVTGNNASTNLSFMYQSEFDNGTACVWDSDFVEDISIPDGTVVNVGQNFTKTWRLRNSGTCPWDNFQFVEIEDDGDAFELIGQGTDQTFFNLPFVAAGEEVDISITMRLRNTVQDAETVRATFQIEGVGDELFGTMPYVEVEANRN